MDQAADHALNPALRHAFDVLGIDSPEEQQRLLNSLAFRTAVEATDAPLFLTNLLHVLIALDIPVRDGHRLMSSDSLISRVRHDSPKLIAYAQRAFNQLNIVNVADKVRLLSTNSFVVAFGRDNFIPLVENAFALRGVITLQAKIKLLSDNEFLSTVVLRPRDN